MCEYVQERGRESGPKPAQGTLIPLPTASQKNTAAVASTWEGRFSRYNELNKRCGQESTVYRVFTLCSH